jgi:hypothetical protein
MTQGSIQYSSPGLMFFWLYYYFIAGLSTEELLLKHAKV